MSTQPLKDAQIIAAVGLDGFYSKAECLKIGKRVLALATAQPPACTGCNGRGEVGGLRPDGYDSEQCPFCKGTGTAQAAPSDALRELIEACDAQDAMRMAHPATRAMISAETATQIGERVDKAWKDARAALATVQPAQPKTDLAACNFCLAQAAEARAELAQYKAAFAGQPAQPKAEVVHGNPCKDCGGSGMDGDVGEQGQVITVDCAACHGTGEQRAALAGQPAAQQGEGA